MAPSKSGDFCYWVLSGDSSVYTNNFVDYSYDQFGADYSPNGTNAYFAALGQVGDLAYLSQPLPTQPGQAYLLSLYLENNSGATPNQFQVLWNTNSSTPNIIYNFVDQGAFGWTELPFLVTASSNVTTLEFGFRNDMDFDGLDNVSVMPVPALSFQAPTVTAGVLQLVWPTLPGLQYEVQYTTDLAQPNWTILPGAGPTTATASTLTASDTLGSDPQRFYRVALLPP